LPGWANDDHLAAFKAFLKSCERVIAAPRDKAASANLAVTCAEAVKTAPAVRSKDAARTFFEKNFTPNAVVNKSRPGMVTGYYEPLLRGARKRGGPYQTPLHGVPDDLLNIDMGSLHPELKGMRLRGRVVGNTVVPYATRAEMMQSDVLASKVLFWVDDPIEAFFLQVQGSGRVQLVDTKETVRVAYANQNGHPYRSIGRYLVEKEEMALDQASAQGIKAWYQANPERRQELLNANPSYVFFKEEKLTKPIKGPKGALGIPLTSERSIAVDPQFVPLGFPDFLATTVANRETPLQRLFMAQDSGGAIKNAVRADFFWGFGADAGAKAGRMKQQGRMWVLLPRVAVPARVSNEVSAKSVQ
jgi:membrane-bound lytic murein transglycosylase A